jgi:hypothetical protein
MSSPLSLSRRDFNRGLLAVAADILSGGQISAAVAEAARVPLFDFAIAGGCYHGLPQALPGLRIGDSLDLRREPENPYDDKAIAVLRHDGLKLGYIPRCANAPIAQLLDANRVVRAEIVRMLINIRRDHQLEDYAFTDVGEGDPILHLTVDAEI